MPCYDAEECNEKQIKTNRIIQLNDRINKLEAGLCAIITELEKRNIADEILSQASKSGLINLMDFWLHHSKEDETRLSRELHKFSEHEQEVLKRLLNAR